MAPIQFMSRAPGAARSPGGEASARIPFIQSTASPSQEENTWLFSGSPATAERAQAAARLPVPQHVAPAGQRHTAMTSHAQQLAQHSAPQELQQASWPLYEALQEQAAAVLRPGGSSGAAGQAPQVSSTLVSGIHFLGGDSADDLFPEFDSLPSATDAQQSHSVEDASWPVPWSLAPIFTGCDLHDGNGAAPHQLTGPITAERQHQASPAPSATGTSPITPAPLSPEALPQHSQSFHDAVVDVPLPSVVSAVAAAHESAAPAAAPLPLPPSTGSSPAREVLAPATGSRTWAAGEAAPVGGGGAVASSSCGHTSGLQPGTYTGRGQPVQFRAVEGLPGANSGEKAFEFEVVEAQWALMEEPGSPLAEGCASQ